MTDFPQTPKGHLVTVTRAVAKFAGLMELAHQLRRELAVAMTQTTGDAQRDLLVDIISSVKIHADTLKLAQSRLDEARANAQVEVLNELGEEPDFDRLEREALKRVDAVEEGR